MRRLEAIRDRAKFTSVVCVMELKYGCARVIHGAKLWQRIQIEILERVGVLSVDVTIAEQAGELLADMRRKGRAAAAEDVLIAATALVHGLVVVTHNIRDFVAIPGLQVEDWM